MVMVYTWGGVWGMHNETRMIMRRVWKLIVKKGPRVVVA